MTIKEAIYKLESLKFDMIPLSGKSNIEIDDKIVLSNLAKHYDDLGEVIKSLECFVKNNYEENDKQEIERLKKIEKDYIKHLSEERMQLIQNIQLDCLRFGAPSMFSESTMTCCCGDNNETN